jgi:hypothetical protein
MGALAMGGADGPKIESAVQMLGLFAGGVGGRLRDWEERLGRDPAGLSRIESEVQAAFAEGAGMIVAGLLAVVLASPELAAATERTRQGFGYRLERGRNRTRAIRLLGGFVMWATSLYCAPARGWFGKLAEKRPGVHVELEQFGFAKGVTPGVESQVARQAAVCPSLELAREELARGGLKLDGKAVRRITLQCGEDLLRLRTHWLLEWRAGHLPAGTELAGQRVTVQIDGGRTRLRGTLRDKPALPEPVDENGLLMADAPGRSRKRPSRTFDAPWREPKLVTIFVHDEHGRMKEKTRATIDGTFLGPDAVAEVVAMHLHRLGAASAASLTFVGDGAVWIWDRVGWIVEKAGIGKAVAIHQVLDCCHAVHHIALALKEYGLSEQQRMAMYRQLRTLLRNGQWRAVTDQLQELLEGSLHATGTMQREIDYLRKHGSAGRLSYPHFKGLGLPMGSGAIESSIRRVVNQRLKSNAMYWRESGAESMLQLRSLVVSQRWDEALASKQTLRRQTRLTTWHWQPQPAGPPEAETTPTESTTIHAQS